jgi:HPt (histidine-containing phosphotransfer) domain-containing protein
MFLDELPGILSQIHVAAAEGDADALARAAHKLKGSAITVGFSRVGAATLELEELAQSSPTRAAVTSLVARLEAACEEVRELGERFCLPGTAE